MDADDLSQNGRSLPDAKREAMLEALGNLTRALTILDQAGVATIAAARLDQVIADLQDAISG